MMDPSSSSDSGDGGGIPFVSEWIAAGSRKYQNLLDRTNPHVRRRWAGFGVLAAAYVVRVAVLQGFYVVTYALGIYALNLLIAFLSPQVDPEVAGSGPTELPTRSSDEFRPFVRRLPEFKLWYSITKAFFIAFILTFFDAFDVPVFWPILLFYFLVLFTVTMKRQILHMMKYKYLPFSSGKQRYGREPVPTQEPTPSGV